MAQIASDTTTLQTLKDRLGTPVIGDVCDLLGRHHQCLPPQIRPMDPGMKLVGRAMPVLMTDTFAPPSRPFGLLTEALDQLADGEIYLCGGGLKRSAYWGELLTATSKHRGAVGAVIEGWHRDSRQVLAQDWPVFSWGAFAQDSGVRSQVADYRVRLEIGGVLISPGDLVVADLDGVVVVPQDIEDEVIQRALEKASAENQVLHAIQQGMSSTAAWERYGVL